MPSLTVQNASISINIIVTLGLYGYFFLKQSKKKLAIFLFSLIISLCSAGMAKTCETAGSLVFVFCFFKYHSVWFSGRDYVFSHHFKPQVILYASFSKTDFSSCKYHLVACLNVVSCPIACRYPILPSRVYSFISLRFRGNIYYYYYIIYYYYYKRQRSFLSLMAHQSLWVIEC